MNKILITGAAGFIGSHLVETLLENNIPVERLRLFVLKNEPLDNLPKLNFDIYKGDIQNEADVTKAMDGVSLVYHLAALTIDGAKYFTQEEYTAVNVQGTENVLKACKKEKTKIIFFSSIAVFGLPAWVGDINNWDETRPKNPKEIYGESKLEAEKKIVDANKKWGIPYIILRPTSAYGPRDKRNLLELYNVVARRIFFYIGNGNNKMDYVYVKDITQAAYLAGKSKKINDDYIIGAGTPVTLNEVVLSVAKSINVPVPNIHVPKKIALWLSFVIEKTYLAVGMKPILFPARVKVMTSNCYYNIAKAKKNLGYKPAFSFEKGAKITGKWLLENGLI